MTRRRVQVDASGGRVLIGKLLPRHQYASATLIEAGWLPPAAAALAWGITIRELRRRARDGAIRFRRVVPGSDVVLLYEPPPEVMP